MSIDNIEKIHFGIPKISNGEQFGSAFGSHPNVKRRKTEEYEESAQNYPGKVTTMVYSDTRGYPPSRTFLSIRHNACIYHTDDWKPRGCSMYLPLTEDIMINTKNIEQISFESDQFFLADEKGNYMGAKPGNAIHLWRFDPGTRKLFISRCMINWVEHAEHRRSRQQPKSKPSIVQIPGGSWHETRV